MEYKTLGKQIREARDKLGISQQELCDKCGFEGLTRCDISNYERDVRVPSRATLTDICTALNMKWITILVPIELPKNYKKK